MTMQSALRYAIAVVLMMLMSAGLISASTENERFRKMYGKAEYDDIAERYNSGKRISQLSADNQTLLLRAVLRRSPESILAAFGQTLNDDELPYFAIAALLQVGRTVPLDRTFRIRLERTKAGHLALLLNIQQLPVVSSHAAAVRDARVEVLRTYFFESPNPDRRRAAIRKLAASTVESYRNNRFGPEIPPPYVSDRPESEWDLVFNLTVAPYLPEPERLLVWIGRIHGTNR